MIKREQDESIIRMGFSIKRMKIGLGVSILIIVMLSFSIATLSGNRERIVIIPQNMGEAVWVDASTVSETYLRQFADYFAHLTLNINPHTAEQQFAMLLTNTHPKYYASLKTILVERSNNIKRKSVTTHFSPRSYEVDSDNLEVRINGQLELGEGSRKELIDDKSFLVSFVIENRRIWVKSIKEIEK